jgi:hypothetical protein
VLQRVSSREYLEKTIDKATSREALRIQREIIKTFGAQGAGSVRWAPLSAMTLELRARRGFAGSKALMDRGDLRRSIKVTKLTGRDAAGRFTSGGDGSYFIGVHRNARSSDGGPLVNIAVIHEGGATIKIFGGSPARIPARPFVGPVWEKMGKGVAERIAKDFRDDVLGAGTAGGLG